MEVVFDIETDGLKPSLIHVVSLKKTAVVQSLPSYDKMRDFFTTEGYFFIGHNIVGYDIPAVKKILGVKFQGVNFQGKFIDTLWLSRALYPDRNKHDLASWGEDLGFPKPVVDFEQDHPYEVYRDRCEADVEINSRLWARMKTKLMSLYGTWEEALRFCAYITFKAQCVVDQEDVGFKLALEDAQALADELSVARGNRLAALKAALPRPLKMASMNPPKKPFKQDGTYSSVGGRWFTLLQDQRLPRDYDQRVVYFTGETLEPNPNSHAQIKEWLYGLGWVPQTFKYEQEKAPKKGLRKIPQVSLPNGKGLCPSVKKLDHPGIEHLEGLTVISHRLTVLTGEKGWLNTVDDEGFLHASALGLTNTLRLKHTVLANIPGVDKPWGKELRSLLTCPEGYEIMGADLVSLEDTTKRHFTQPYDPSYVEEQQKEGYDPHLTLAVSDGACTPQEMRDHIAGVIDISLIRQLYKKTNYSALYGIGAAGLSRDIGCPKAKAQGLIDAYWKKNLAVKEVAKNVETKRVDGGLWLFNPVSKFWYSLRSDKDKFSTLNQGTASYVFDVWLGYCKVGGIDVCAQFHDEWVAWYYHSGKDRMHRVAQQAIDKTNKKLNLNVPILFEAKTGGCYADVH